MIFAFALAWWSFQEPGDAAPPADAEIVVTGERLKRIRVVTKHDRKTGQKRCVVKRSSGDGALDTGFCEVVLGCARTAQKPKDMSACVSSGVAEMLQRRPRPAAK
jgi:hypothetical protein